jgi:hypothetical protein
MTKYGHIGWRVAAVITAFAATAVLAVTLTRAPESQTALDVSCPTSGLRASLELGQPRTWTPQVAGGRYYTLEFTNVSDQVCSLFGFPQVSAYAASQLSASQGRPSPAESLASGAIEDSMVRPQRVRLEPGETAEASLRITDTTTSQPAVCVRVTAEELRVTLPHYGQPAFVPVHIPVCSENGRLSLSVQPLQARSGASGYTMP